MTQSSRAKMPEYEGWCRRVEIRGILVTRLRVLHYYRRGRLLCGRHQEVLACHCPGGPWPDGASFPHGPFPDGDVQCKECQAALKALQVLESRAADRAAET